MCLPSAVALSGSRFTGGQASLRVVPNHMRSQVGMCLSWEFRGNILVLANAGCRFSHQCIISEGIVAE